MKRRTVVVLSAYQRLSSMPGARSLLVSHWAVSSDTTVRLTTRMFEHHARGQPPARALRLSMLELMAGSDRHRTAHPFFWAPFVVLGEGAAVQRPLN